MLRHTWPSLGLIISLMLEHVNTARSTLFVLHTTLQE